MDFAGRIILRKRKKRNNNTKIKGKRSTLTYIYSRILEKENIPARKQPKRKYEGGRLCKWQ